METRFEALRMQLEGLMEVAQPDDYFRLKRTLALVKRAEALEATRQALDQRVWRYATERSAASDATGNSLDRMIRRLNLKDGVLN